MSSAGESPLPLTRSMLLPVPSSRAERIWDGASGPYCPKTRSSATPPEILIPVSREISRRIWLRLELLAEMESVPPV